MAAAANDFIGGGLVNAYVCSHLPRVKRVHVLLKSNEINAHALSISVTITIDRSFYRLRLLSIFLSCPQIHAHCYIWSRNEHCRRDKPEQEIVPQYTLHIREQSQVPRRLHRIVLRLTGRELAGQACKRRVFTIAGTLVRSQSCRICSSIATLICAQTHIYLHVSKHGVLFEDIDLPLLTPNPRSTGKYNALSGMLQDPMVSSRVELAFSFCCHRGHV